MCGRNNILRRLILAALAVLAWLVPAAAFAKVEIGFYSKELGVTFPHAFVVLKGRLDGSGEEIDEAFGFTAKTVSPAILMGSVPGKVIAEEEPYVSKSDRQFTLELNDDEYHAVQVVVEKWRNRTQPSYNLNKRNCIHFVAEIAEAAGLKVEYPKALMKKPRSYLQFIESMNESAIAAHGGAVMAGADGR